MKKIAIEEHFMCPDMFDYFAGTLVDIPAAAKEYLINSLSDLGEGRLAAMDAANIDMSVCSLAGPGVQVEPDAAKAIDGAQKANDYLAEKIAPNLNRLRGFAHLPIQDGKAAAKELERSVTQLGFVGGLINGQTNGQYLDDEDSYPLWEMAEVLDVPLYIHPSDPQAQPQPLVGQPMLQRATWGWMVETGSHAMRVVFSDVFHRFPKAQMILGHMGETLPFQLWRFDSRAKLYGWNKDIQPSDIIKRNVAVTISGVYSLEPLQCTLAALGQDRVMFAADYPFENAIEAGGFMDAAQIDDDVRAAVAYKNAARLLKIEI